MKRIIIFFIFICCGIHVFTQEFDIRWIDDMSRYIGKHIRDIPDEYAQSTSDRNNFSRKLSNNIEEGFSVENNNIVSVIWAKVINSRSLQYSEFDKLVTIFNDRFGKQLFENDYGILWNWNSKPLMVIINSNIVGVSLSLPEFIGITQEQWNQVIEELSKR